MSKSLKTSCLAIALAGIVSCCAFFSACEKKNKKEVVARYSVDTRTVQYGFYSADGELIGEYKDMYKAIADCIEDGDDGDYIAKISGADSDVKLFIMRDYYDGNSTDQYFYYENGTSLDRYTPWKENYHTDLATYSKNDVVIMKSANGLSNYRQGYETVGVDSVGLGSYVETWNVFPFTDASIQVNLAAYCGITKVVYNIKLSEAQIYPNYEGYETTYAKVGFIIPDIDLVAHMGFAADTTTGEWYYYQGNGECNLENDSFNEVNETGVLFDLEKSILSSTWNEAGGYYTPDSDMILTAEIVPVDDDGAEYYIYRVTAELDDGTKIVREYEHAKMSSCATMRFFAALDVYKEEGMPSFDNGAQFKNLKITSAKGTIFERTEDPANYGGNVISMDVGEYDLLNSNPETAARFQTILYNRAIVSYDFSTLGQDIYNFSYKLNAEAPALSARVKAVKDAIEALPAIDSITAANANAIKEARAAYNALVKVYQTELLGTKFGSKNYSQILEAAEAKLASLG